MLRYYWQIGADIHNRQFENRYGSRFYANASRDLRVELGVNEGLSETTLKYTKYFYELYAPLFPNRQQVVDDFPSQILQQVAGELQSAEIEHDTNRQQVVDGFPSLIRRQLVDDFDLLFQIPWSHHVNIIDKVKGVVRQAHQPVPEYIEGRQAHQPITARKDTFIYSNVPITSTTLEAQTISIFDSKSMKLKVVHNIAKYIIPSNWFIPKNMIE